MDIEEDALKRMTVRRKGRILMYGGLAISGALGAIFPSTLVSDQVSHPVQIMQSIAMILTSLICLYGSITDRWIGEYAGIPLLAAVLALYGISAIMGIENNRSLALIAYGLVVISFASGLVARWFDVKDIKNHAVALGVLDKGE